MAQGQPQNSLRARAVAWLAGVQLASGFYLPGVAPTEYPEGGKVEIKVTGLSSTRTQLPYGYYSAPFCQPEGGPARSIENLGEILGGEVIQSTPYDVRMMQNKTCEVLCRKTLTDEDKASFKQFIEDDYMVHMVSDNLPVGTKFYRKVPAPLGVRGIQDAQEIIYVLGFAMGVRQVTERDVKFYLNNHLKFTLKFHPSPDEEGRFRIVGFEVEPHSISQATIDDTQAVHGVRALCNEGAAVMGGVFDLEQHSEVIYTYDVSWEESEVRWASRWDAYLKMGQGQIHWFSILNSLLITLVLAAMVAAILLRTVHRDVARYNELATVEEAAEETGWKLVHGDVFRRPRFSRLLAASVGCGIQVFGMSAATMGFAILGFLSPAHRGGLLQSLMLLFTFAGVLAGWVAGHVYKVMGGDDWRTVMLMTALFFPTLVFAVFFVLNLLIWGQQSSGAVPFSTMFALLVLWFGISVPLVFLGSYFAVRQEALSVPCRTNHMARRIPTQPWFAGSIFTSLVGGVLPFGAVFTELFFIMTSLWQHQTYYLFGFLTLVLVILMITSAEISVALTYFQLTSEDYLWWWRSFFASGASGLYVGLYSVLYFNTRLQIDRVVPMAMYFGYMGVVSLLFCLMTGSIGFLSTFVFVRSIYGSVKID
jgi:transmembrane 9 superfamily protein 2/4